MNALKRWVIQRDPDEERKRQALTENAKACLQRLSETDHGRLAAAKVARRVERRQDDREGADAP